MDKILSRYYLIVLNAILAHIVNDAVFNIGIIEYAHHYRKNFNILP